MNSSGIKRGLATAAVSALAVTGVPFIASSASAATGDAISVTYVGPVRNAGDHGGVIVLKTKGLTAGDELNLKLADTSLADLEPDTPSQNVDLVPGSAVFTADDATNEFGGKDGFDEISFRVTATTPAAGDVAKFAVFIDDDTMGDVDPSEARAQVEVTTSGPVAALEVSPAGQTAPEGVNSGDYSVTLRDSAGRLTQLELAEVVTVTAAGTTLSDASIDKTEAARGVGKFKAQAATKGLYPISIAGPNSTTANATLDVVSAATLSEAEVDIVTGADEWKGFGDAGDATPTTFGTPVAVRVDQNSLRIDIKSVDGADADTNPDDAGATVSLTATGALGAITFDGKAEKTYTTTLDANGVGSITITPDAGTIVDGRSFSIAGSGVTATTIQFVRSAIHATTAIKPAANTYVSAFGGSVDVTATITDQFGLPVTTGLMTVELDGGVNDTNTQSAKVAVNENGQATFTITDTKATATSRAADNLTFRYFVDQFAAAPASTATNAATIQYTANGQGNDFTLQVDGTTAAGTAYDPAKQTTLPLTDAIAQGPFVSANGDEYVNLGIVNGTTGAPVTVSVDNGAVVLKGTETELTQGAASDSGVVGTDSFRIAGTKEGLTTVTVTSAGVTKTAQFTVAQDATAGVLTTARNIAVSGPADATSGEQITFTAVITDAFGNGVAGFNVNNLNIQVSGPGRFQDSDSVSNANGEIKLNVSVDDDADGPITLQVKPTSAGDQFGAAANKLTSAVNSPAAPGLTESVAVASATVSDVTNLAALEQAVADAEAAVKAAQDALTVAQGDLAVAQARLDVANAQLKDARQDVRQAKRALKRAKRKGEGIRAARQEFRAARAERAEAKGDRNVARVARNAERTVVEIEQADLAAAQAELEAAQAELDAANGEG